MSSRRQTVILGPSFNGFGKRPSRHPCHHVDLETGMGPWGPMIEERRTNPFLDSANCWLLLGSGPSLAVGFVIYGLREEISDGSRFFLADKGSARRKPSCRPHVTGGQVADCTAGELLLQQMPQVATLHGDKGCDSKVIRGAGRGPRRDAQHPAKGQSALEELLLAVPLSQPKRHRAYVRSHEGLPPLRHTLPTGSPAIPLGNS